jgi:D-glycero-D-manno-heptose 1,7-bisphosphate phosphatase
MSSAVTLRPAVFLDRDGVINEKRSDYVRSWEDFVYLPGALDALSRLARRGAEVVVVTNQSAIGRGKVSVEVIQEIHRRMQSDILATGGPLVTVYICPHVPWDGCYCRKPNPGLLLQAADDLGIHLPSSVLVGDSVTDIGAAQAAGCRTIYIGSPRDRGSALRQPALVARRRTIGEAVDWILSDPAFRSGERLRA